MNRKILTDSECGDEGAWMLREKVQKVRVAMLGGICQGEQEGARYRVRR